MATIKYEITRHRYPDRDPSSATFEQSEGAAWIAKQIAKNTYGKPAREIKLDGADDFEKGREISRRTIQDDDGNDIILVSLPADYSVVEVDVTADLEAEETARAEKKAKKDNAKRDLGSLPLTKVAELKVAVKAILDYLEIE